MAKTPNTRYMDTVGNGTGTKNAKANGSVTPVILKIKPAAGETFECNRMIISYLIDANSFNVGYGKRATDLTNGFELKVITGAAGGSTVWDITDGIPVKSNHDWKNLCFDENVSVYGSTESAVSYRYTFTRDDGPVILDGSNGDELQVIMNDDLTDSTIGLVHQYFRVGMRKL